MVNTENYVGYSCKFPLCKNVAYRKHRTKRFFKFPKEQGRQELWRKICNIDPHVRCLNFRVCEDHFDNLDILGNRVLSPRAVPKAAVFVERDLLDKLPLCVVPGCGTTEKPMHRLPDVKTDFDRFLEWVKRIKDPNLRKYSKENPPPERYICSRHFTCSDFDGKRLRYVAIPSLNLPAGTCDTLVSGQKLKENSGIARNQIDPTVLEAEKNHHLSEFDELLENSKHFNDLMKDASSILKEVNKISNAKSGDEFCNDDDFNIFEFIQPHSTTSKPHFPTLTYKELNESDPQTSTCKPNLLTHIPTYKEIANSNQKALQNGPLEKPFFKALKSFSLDSNSINEICRICLRILLADEIKKLDDQTPLDNVNQLKDILHLMIPNLDLEIYTDIVVCKKCTEHLISSYELRKTWMSTEENFRKIVENKKGITKRDSDLILVTESKIGEVITEFTKKNMITNINFDHDYGEPTEIPQLMQQEEKTVCTEKILEDISKLTGTNKELSIFDNKNEIQAMVDKVQIFYNGVNLKSKIGIDFTKLRKKKKEWGEGPYVCEKCAFCTQRLRSFQRHLRQHNLNIWPNGYPVKKKRKPITKTFQCNLCNRMFSTAYRLQRHSLNHNVHKCGLCEKEFNSSSTLRDHIQYVHLGKYYQCHFCGKQIRHKSDLLVHLRKHSTSTNTYKCDACPKKFRTVYHLRRHFKRLHREAGEFTCQYCGKTVKYKASLLRHMRVFHLNKEESICNICNKPYWKKCNLIKHKIRVHGIYPER